MDDGGECELRCDNGIKFGELLLEANVLEVKCRSTRCGAGRGIIVIHAFDTETGKLVGTEIFREPTPTKEEGQ